MKIALCDDSQIHLEALKNVILSTVYIGEARVEAFSSGLELLHKIQDGVNYDIVFLDIDMPEINGIELGKKIHDISPTTVLIFITAYPEYAIEGYECEALRYILKPYADDKIKETLGRAIEVSKAKKHFITVKVQNRWLRIFVNDIYYLECCRRHVLYHTNNRVIETSGIFSKAYEELKSYGFFQVHQGYIVNLDKIYDFKEYDIILDNGMTVPVSVRKKNSVMIQYAKFLKGS